MAIGGLSAESDSGDPSTVATAVGGTIRNHDPLSESSARCFLEEHAGWRDVIVARVRKRLSVLTPGGLSSLLTDSLKRHRITGAELKTWHRAQARGMIGLQRLAADQPGELAGSQGGSTWLAAGRLAPIWRVDSKDAARLVLATADEPADQGHDAERSDLRSQVEAWLRDQDPVWLPVSRANREIFARSLQVIQRSEDLEDRFQATLEREKLLAMKELAYGASHEINNPLANISSRAQMLMRGETDPQRRRALATINSQAFRAHEMIADMMLFAKPPAPESRRLEWVDFQSDLQQKIEMDRPDEVDLTWQSDGAAAVVIADPIQLTVAVRAIWTNAFEAMGNRGTLTICSRVAASGWPGPSAGWAELEIRDTGPGIRPEVRRHLFDPFFSGREAGRGLGFGLSKAWRVIELHGGQLLVDSQVGAGATLTVRLPLAPPEPETD